MYIILWVKNCKSSADDKDNNNDIITTNAVNMVVADNLNIFFGIAQQKHGASIHFFVAVAMVFMSLFLSFMFVDRNYELYDYFVA